MVPKPAQIQGTWRRCVELSGIVLRKRVSREQVKDNLETNHSHRRDSLRRYASMRTPHNLAVYSPPLMRLRPVYLYSRAVSSASRKLAQYRPGRPTMLPGHKDVTRESRIADMLDEWRRWENQGFEIESHWLIVDAKASVDRDFANRVCSLAT